MSGRIVLGLGGTVDYEVVWDADAFQTLVAEHGVRMDELEDGPSSSAATQRDIGVTILRSMLHQQGTECYVPDPEVLMAWAGRWRHRVTLGGTCVRAALAMHNIGLGSLVHLVSISDEVRALLPGDVQWICSAQHDSLDPHVIVQYPAGQEVTVADGVVRAERPNRVILVNDPPNEELVISPLLADAVSSSDAVLVSGFNTIKSRSLLRQRIDDVAQALRQAPAQALVVYEDAGFHDDSMRADVLERMTPYAHVHSMNEDEAQRYVGTSIDLADPHEVASMMSALRRISRAPAVMVHTSRYAAVVGENARMWSMAATRGCQLASTRFVYSDDFGPQEHALTGTAPREELGTALAAAEPLREAGVVIAPGFAVEAGSPTTIGLGDSFVGGVMAYLAQHAPTA